MPIYKTFADSVPDDDATQFDESKLPDADDASEISSPATRYSGTVSFTDFDTIFNMTSADHMLCIKYNDIDHPVMNNICHVPDLGVFELQQNGNDWDYVFIPENRVDGSDDKTVSSVDFKLGVHDGYDFGYSCLQTLNMDANLVSALQNNSSRSDDNEDNFLYTTENIDYLLAGHDSVEDLLTNNAGKNTEAGITPDDVSSLTDITIIQNAIAMNHDNALPISVPRQIFDDFSGMSNIHDSMIDVVTKTMLLGNDD